MMSRALMWVICALLLAYPLLVFYSIQLLQPRYIGLTLVVVLLARLLLVKVNMNAVALRTLLPVTLAGGVCCVFIVLSNDPLMVRANPIFINAVMLVVFARSLINPPSMVERFARLAHPDLPQQAVDYTRKVTKVWCLFFAANGFAAAYTTFFCRMETWTLYNGLIAYMIMGLIVAVEYLFRLRVMAATPS